MLSNSFPQWTTEITDTIVTGEDMLGVEGAAQSYQQWLIPGIISTTDHARYYSFYAWVLYRYINSSTGNRLIRDFRGKFYKRHEVALILGTYGHHLNRVMIRGLVGAGTNSMKVRSWWETSDPVSLDVNYFQNKLGGLGQYYLTAMQVMGIIGYSENPNWVFPLTHRGQELAVAYENSITETNYYRQLEQEGQLEYLTQEDAINFGKAGCICAEALSKGKDLPLLREAFFRFDQKGDENPHVRRRFALAITLDMIGGAQDKFERYMIRPALYLGEYSANQIYHSSPELEDWAFRWKMVEIRHHYTFGLQALWGAFILKLREQTGGMPLSEFMGWARDVIGQKVFDLPLSQYLDTRCNDVGLRTNWQISHSEFATACLRASEKDEYSLFLTANNNPQDAGKLLSIGTQLLAQHFLRFFHLHQESRKEWKELAERERLSISSFYDFMLKGLADQLTLGQWLETLYKEYVLGQHEFIALEKMRYQGYDTFKFHYREGQFFWPFNRSNYWREPIRLAGNRLGNALSIVIDLGLAQENETGQISLTIDGREYLSKVVEMVRHGN
jgi:hypothetical protein